METSSTVRNLFVCIFRKLGILLIERDFSTREQQILYLNSFCATGDDNRFFANSIDPNETVRNEPSNLDLHCFNFIYKLLSKR